MKTIALALLIGLASATAAHAEWEILDRGSAVAAHTPPAAPVATASARSTAGSTTAQVAAVQK